MSMKGCHALVPSKHWLVIIAYEAEKAAGLEEGATLEKCEVT